MQTTFLNLLKKIFLLLIGAFLLFTQAEQWTTRANMPIAKAEIGSVKLDDKIYIAAGFAGSLSPTNQLFVYTPALNSWDSSVSLPVKLHHLRMTTFNGLI